MDYQILKNQIDQDIWEGKFYKINPLFPIRGRTTTGELVEFNSADQLRFRNRQTRSNGQRFHRKNIEFPITVTYKEKNYTLNSREEWTAIQEPLAKRAFERRRVFENNIRTILDGEGFSERQINASMAAIRISIRTKRMGAKNPSLEKRNTVLAQRWTQ